MSELNYVISSILSSIEDLGKQQRTEDVIRELRIQMYLLDRMIELIKSDQRYTAVSICAVRGVAFIQRDLLAFEERGVSPNAKMLSVRTKRTMSWILSIYSIDYKQIQSENAWIGQELAEFLFRPDKIQAWIEQGRELESYIP